MPEVLPAALEEMIAAVQFYESRREGLGVLFRDVVADSMDLVDFSPDAWPPYLAPGVPEGVRHIPLRPFRDQLVFVTEPTPLVVAVAHSDRRPGYWVGRLP